MMKKMRKYQEGGMATEDDLEKYMSRQRSGTSGSFPPVAGGGPRTFSTSPDGMSGGIGPQKTQSSGLLGRNESMLGKAAKMLTPGGGGSASAVAAAKEAKRKKEEGYKSGGYVKAADGCAKRGKTKGTMVRMK